MARAIILPSAGLLSGLLILLGLAAWRRLSDEAVRVEATRALTTAQALAVYDDIKYAISPGDENVLADATVPVNSAMDRDPQILYVAVAAPRKSRLTRFRPADEEARTLASKLPQLEAAQAQLTPDTAVRLTVDGVDVILAAVAPGWSGTATSDATDFPSKRDEPYGRLFVGISLRPVAAAQQELAGGLLGAGLLATLIYVGAMTLVVRRVSRRLGRVAARARKVQDGDFTARVDDPTRDEIGIVGQAFDEATARVGRIVARIGAVSGALEATAGRIAQAADSVRKGAVAQRREVDGSAGVADVVAAALADIARRADAAHGEARSGSAATARISVIADGISRGVAEAGTVVEAASDSVATITQSIAAVAARAEEVSGAATSTSSAILELNTTIHRVRETAEAAARLAESAGGDAERGQDALAATIEGIDRIREASRAVSEVTVGLERRAKEIGAVLELVADLTERTNLLALNASIIAAQAGVEGRGFAVVAAEIKELARRTANSAGEISLLVAGVEEDSHAARRAAEVGAASVEEGAERARATARALSEIFNRVRDSAQLSLSIATATDEQVRASRYVAEAMSQVTAAVGEIARSTSDQTQKGRELGDLAGRLRELVRSVGEATRDQRDGARQVASSVEALQGSVEQVAAAQRARAGDGARILSSLTSIRAVAAGHEGAVTALDDAVADLGAHARALAEELDRLQT